VPEVAAAARVTLWFVTSVSPLTASDVPVGMAVSVTAARALRFGVTEVSVAVIVANPIVVELVIVAV
jgi:hypothetical protein